MISQCRYELTDFEWSVIEPLLSNKPRGFARVDERRMLNGIYWRLRPGSPWADIPERYGPYTTCYNRFVRWRKAGVWDRLFEAVSKAYEGDVQMIDSSSIRVHQHGTNGKKRGGGRSDCRRWARRWKQMHGALARRADDQDPCAGRCARVANHPQADAGPGVAPDRILGTLESLAMQEIVVPGHAQTVTPVPGLVLRQQRIEPLMEGPKPV